MPSYVTYTDDDGTTVVSPVKFGFWKVCSVLLYADAVGADEGRLSVMLEAHARRVEVPS